MGGYVSGMIGSLNGLTDVNAGTPSDNDSLTWDDATSKWINEPVVATVANFIVTAKTDNYNVLAGDFGANKALSMNSADDKTFTLPSVAAGDIGDILTFIKLGAGKVTIATADADTIHDSAAGGTLYNDIATETYASVSIMLTGATQWSMINKSGIGWITT